MVSIASCRKGSTRIQKLALLSLFTTFLVGGGTLAQQPPTDSDTGSRQKQTDPVQKPVFTERIEVAIAEIEVVVTDKKGNPVEGLTRKHFRIKLDGEPVPIQNFYAASTSKVSPRRSDDAAPTPKPVPGKPKKAAETTPFVRRLRLAVVIDPASMPFGRGKVVVQDVAKQLGEGLRPGDQVMVVSLQPEPKIEQEFTEKWPQAARAMQEVKVGSSLIGHGARERRRILLELRRISAQGFPDMVRAKALALRSAIHSYARQQRIHAVATLRGMGQLVQSMSGLVGKKVVLYVGGGVADHPGVALYSAWQNKLSSPAYADLLIDTTGPASLFTGSESMSSLFRELGRYANINEVTIYAVGAESSRVLSGVSAEFRGIEPVTGRSWTTATEARFRTSMAAPLQTMAGVTGGTAMTSPGDFGRVVSQIQIDGEAYYSLGVNLPQGETERFAVDVEVTRPDLRVRYRGMVRPSSPIQRAEKATLATLLYAEVKNPLGLELELGEVERGEEGLLLPVTVRFPFVNLVLVPRKDIHLGRLTLFVAAMDKGRDLSSTQTIAIPIRIPTRDLVTALQQVGQYQLKLRIRPGWHRIAVGVYDQIASTSSTTLAETNVRAPDSG